MPTLFSGAGLIGAHVDDRDGDYLGTVVDTMLACENKQLSYIVVARGGLGGAGETLRALRPSDVSISDDSVRCSLTVHQVAALSPIDDAAWPAAAPDQGACEPTARATQHLKGFDYTQV